MPLQYLLDTALSRRKPQLDDPDTDVYRVFNGDADGIDGFVVDRYGPVLVAQLHEERLCIAVEEAARLVESLHRILGTRGVYRKTFVRNRSAAGEDIERMHHSPDPWIGKPVDPELPVLENGLRFLIRPYDGFSVGLFPEQRENRRRIRELARGHRVLNAFSYTGSFSVAAAAGGAASVSSVDMHKRYLEWGKANFAANGIETAGHWFFCSDVFEFFHRAQRQGRRFDLIILDPPTFSRSRRPARVFVLEERLGELCRGAMELLDPGGMVLLSTNHRGISCTRLEEELAAASGGRRCTVLERPALPSDFAGDPDYAKTILAKID